MIENKVTTASGRWLSCWLGITFTAMVGLSPAACPRQEISLNGIWDFYPEGGNARHDIRVPSFWDAPQDYGYPAEWLHLRHGIYRKQFKVPPSLRDQQIYLSIQRVAVIAKVFINDQPVGAEDSNGYLMMLLPYLIDLTPHLKPDADNQLEIRVWGGKSMIASTDAQDKLLEADDFPPDTKIDGRFLYPYCVDHWDGRRGLNSDVALVAKPKVQVADVFVIPNLHKNGNPQDDEIMVRLTLANCDGKSHKVRVLNHAIRQGGTEGKDFEPFTVTLPANSTMEVNVQNARWTNAAYWWPHDPALYVLETTLTERDQLLDTASTRFGFREFYVNADHYELNGIRANLRGDAYEFSWHEGYRHGPATAPVLSTKELIPQLQEQLVREYARLNHNMLRPHKASAYAGLYDLCDEIGMMVFDEAPFWETWVRTDERSKPYYEAWVHRWIKARRNHPSIMAWIGANECWFGSTGVTAVQAIRTMDTSRPSFHEDPWGSGIHHDDREEPYEGDEDCRHYTGGYPYYQASFAPVAVFDKEADRQNRIGSALLVFKGKDSIARTLVIYNDEFHGGEEITVNWTAESADPQTGQAAVLTRGSLTIPVPYGQKREHLVTIELPAEIAAGRWLNFILAASKSGAERFRETNRLGALLAAPEPQLVVRPAIINLGDIPADAPAQWHTVRLVNAGGGASLSWTLAGAGTGVNFNRTAGNLRGEQEIHFQIDAAKMPAGTSSRTITITGQDGSTGQVVIQFQH